MKHIFLMALCLFFFIPLVVGQDIPDTYYSSNMEKSQEKALKAAAIDDWGQPTFSHEARVLPFTGQAVTVNWKRFDSELWETIILKPRFVIKSKWQAPLIYDWLNKVADTFFRDRYVIARNDQDYVDASWAAAEHFERFTRIIGVGVKVDYMEAIDSKGRSIIVIDQGKAMTKPSKFSQIETGKKIIRQ